MFLPGEFLIDIDELVLKCRDEHARKYIGEAVADYKVGSFRSCIVATWVAVVYDYLSKIRDIALTGDKAADGELKKFERIRATNDVKGSLDFERDVLDNAKDKFELLSPIEYSDLKRIYEDRNRCAHPSMISSDDIYQPSAELARTHLRNAVTHLLQHEPVQGKTALSQLLKTIDSAYFPVDEQDALERLKTGPLARPRPSLVTDLVKVSLKVLLKLESKGSWDQHLAALKALRQMHRLLVEKVFSEQLNRYIGLVSDENLPWLVFFLTKLPDLWIYLNPTSQAHISRYIEKMPSTDLIPFLLIAKSHKMFEAACSTRINSLTEAELINLSQTSPSPEFIPAALKLYGASNSFATANKLGVELISPLIPLFRPKDIEELFKIASENNQVKGSIRIEDVLKKIKSSGKQPEEQINSLAKSYELDMVFPWLSPTSYEQEEEEKEE